MEMEAEMMGVTMSTHQRILKTASTHQQLGENGADSPSRPQGDPTLRIHWSQTSGLQTGRQDISDG